MTALAPPAANSKRWLILLTVIIGTFLGRLDQTIVNLALPKIIDDYHITVSAAGWIATAYILANAVFVPIWGKLGDTIGRKKVYLLGFGMFIVGSLFAGLAWNLPSMIVFRVIQAIAGSADYPTAMAIIAVSYPTDRERAQALGIWSSSFAAASVFGPLIGGPLIDHFSWRSIFLINIPVGIVGILMAMEYIDESVSERKTMHFDFAGAIALGIALSAVVLVLDKGSEWDWISMKSGICYVATLVSSVAFLWIESVVKEPIVDLKFFTNNIFVQTLLNNFIVFMGMMGSFFLVPIFAQIFLGYDASKTGYMFIPMAIAIVVAAPFGGQLTGKVQPKYVIAGSTIVAGIGLWLYTFVDARSSAIEMMIPLVVMAAGMGFGMSQRTNIIAASVPKSEIGVASSILALARNVAGAFGVAVSATLLNWSVNRHIVEIARYSVYRGVTTAQYQQFVGLISLKAQIDGYRTVFWVSAVLVIVGGFLALLIGNVEMKKNVQVHVE